jgi:lysophospholipase L1-like esterase
MFWEWFIIICSSLIIIALFTFLAYKEGKIKGIKKGADDLLALFLKSGYELKVLSFQIQNRHAKKGGIVFVGDSITQDFPIHDFFPDLTVYNRGIGGDTTEGLKNRLEESIFALEPQKVVLMIGTNDLALLKTTPEKIAQNIHDIVKLIHEKSPNIRIILEGIYPVNTTLDPFSVSTRNNEDIRKVNQLLKNIPQIDFIDLDHDFSDSLGNLKKEYTVEGLHINALGYELIVTKLLPFLK